MRLRPAQAKALGIDIGHAPTRQKYHAQRVNGFDSKREAARWTMLALQERVGDISDLRRQPEFHCWVHGERVCVYKADFYYRTRDGQVVIEDSKGFRTRDYILKRKLVRALFGVEVLES